MKRYLRTAVTLTATAPLLVAGLLALPASAGMVDAAEFDGGFRTTCATVPKEPDGDAQPGPYKCAHTAASTTCAAVVDDKTVNVSVKTCTANLLSGTTTGHADGGNYFGYNHWTCVNGAGTGTFRYRPSLDESLVFQFPVTLSVTDSVMTINGSYTQSGTDRHIVVRAQMPALCGPTYDIYSGFKGNVTPY